ncbi:MAG: DUF2059 domain-containing protein [Myxococcales bacterium]|nr:DUF2059 domain-containing protein [Myxococcales bacterium]
MLWAVLAVGLVSVPQQARADDASKEALVRELLDLTGASALGKQVMDNMLMSLKGTPGVSSDFITKFSELAKPEELTELVVPIYMKHYDEPTLTAAVRFYKTPEGKKLIAAMPAITQESMAAGQAWGADLARRVQSATAQ